MSMIPLTISLNFVSSKSLHLNKLSSFIFKYGNFKTKYLTNPFYPSQICRCLTTSKECLQHTAKGWKYEFRDGHKEERKLRTSHTSCEDGTDAIPHQDLLSKLQDCHTVSDQIKTFCSSVSLTPEDVENRKEFCQYLTELFKPYFPQFKVHLFGSSINGFGFKGCDADVCIQTIFDDKGYVPKVTEPPALDAVIKGQVSADYVAHLPPRMLLRFIRRILRAHSADVHKNILFIKARCPLLRFYNSKHNIFCDFSCENYNSLRNTKLTRLINHLDDRVPALIKFIRYWGKYGGFVGDIDLFNSYAFSLLAIHFLQLRNPPVLPPLKEIIEKSEYLNHGSIDDQDLLLNDLKKFDKSKNNQTVEELLRDYFFHFLTFDYRKVLIPLTSSVVGKEEFLASVIKNDDDVFLLSTITLQDPFRPNFNVTEGAKDVACLRFIRGLIEANAVYQDKSKWHPTAENWGISSLFFQTTHIEPFYRDDKLKWQTDNVHTIKLPMNTDTSLLKHIFQEYLLFECEDEVFTYSEEILSPSLKLNCIVKCNTWIGRDLIRKRCPSTLTTPLEVEKWISKEISKEKSTGKLVFLCQCFENKQDNELDIVLTFKKFDEIIQYLNVHILVIFLKEYIPSMCKKLLL